MHIGLVQVAVKPFIRKVDNVPIYMDLRDNRLTKYKSSLSATISTNIHNRPVFFNCCRDFGVDFTCPMTPEALKLDVHIQGGEFLDLKNIAIMYRVYFRSMSAKLNAKFFNTLPLNTKEIVYFKLKMTNLNCLLQNFSDWMRLQFHKLLSLKTPNRLLFIDADKRTILSKSGKNPKVEFSYDSAHFVNLQVSLELLPVGNRFLIFAQNVVSVQNKDKIASSGGPYQKQLSMILHLLLLHE